MPHEIYHGIYLDNAATTRAFPEVAAAVVRCLTEAYGNPSSIHEKGIEAERLLDESARSLAALLEVPGDEILFTSGGTESNNMAILGALYARGCGVDKVVVSSVEHPSVYNLALELRRRGFDVKSAAVDGRGVIDLDCLRKVLVPGTALVSIMHVNNETGAIQPIREIREMLGDGPHRPLLHVDAVQSLGHVPFSPRLLGADMASFSAHKIHGPKGSGALWVRSGVKLAPIVYGGGQQRSLRSGTENVPGIAGFGEACRRLAADPGLRENHLPALRRAYIEGLRREIPDAVVNGPEETGHCPGTAAPHVLNVGFPRVKAEVLVRLLGSKGVYVSSASACSSRKRGVSRVLEAMRVPRDVAEGSIRLSFGAFNHLEEVERAVAIIAEAVAHLRRLGKGRG
ncbi:MAG: cysteine desulfurase [Firmicutes bacterium]|nr:cysteine desulfurase [Bacillota bacterium]